MAVTGGMGDVTNTFAYDAYGRLTEKVGIDDILFCYNGKYGVITEPSGLVYMRARYYSPELRRFINADVVAGEISNAITLNRYAYANGNPISNVDPLGLAAERENETIFDAMRNKDGSYSIYDNDRFYDRNAFHEQILAFTPSGPAFNPLEGDIGLGSISADFITGGWENEYVDLSLLDFGHAEVSAEIKDGQLSVGALASIWSPSISFNLFGLTIEFGAEVGAVGFDVDVGSGKIGGKLAGGLGLSFSISWD